MSTIFSHAEKEPPHTRNNFRGWGWESGTAFMEGIDLNLRLSYIKLLLSDKAHLI